MTIEEILKSAFRRKLPDFKTEIDWSDIRVICIAPEYKKYDLHAVQMMGANIELWQYRLFDDGLLFFEEIYKKSLGNFLTNDEPSSNKNPIMVEAGKKAALTRASGIYTIEQHINKIDSNKKELLQSTKDFILSLSESIEELPKKFYIAYKISQNFVCLEVMKSKIVLYLKLNPKNIEFNPEICRDVSEIGHYGTGDLEVTIKSEDDLMLPKN
jgi:predicted transport protein